MIKNIIILTLHDVAIACKNRSIYLMLFIPFLIFLSLKLVDISDTAHLKTTIGLLQNTRYAPALHKAINSADRVFTVVPVAGKEEGLQWLKKKRIDGLLIQSDNEQEGVTLVVVKKESLRTLAIVESIAALQKATEGASLTWITEIVPLWKGGIQQQTLPVWVLMLVLLTSFIILPAQVAEEKEKKLLLALLQTPIHTFEWLMAKLLAGMILIHLSILFLHLLGTFVPVNAASYIAFTGIGSFCFCSIGIFIGLMCRNQASARTLGVMFYLPLLLPSALSDFSDTLTAIAPFLPSFQLYEPITSILSEEGIFTMHAIEWLYLFSVGTAAFCAAGLLIKNRWRM